MSLEQTILRNLITNEPYMRKVLPFLQPKYFQGHYNTLFKELCKYVAKYNRLPTAEAFAIELSDSKLINNDDQYLEITQLAPALFEKEEVDNEWLIDKTENWCQERALHISILDAITIIDGKHETLTKTAIPDILQKALGVTFDTNIGHDYLEDFESRYEYYHEDLERIPFDIDYLNKITNGGLVKKTLNVLLAGTGVGKSLIMCHMAAAYLSMGYDVLYITAEMAEERIAERIDANLLDVNINRLQHLSKDQFSDKVLKIKKKTTGKLIIKEYPTGQANVNHIRSLLNELKLKKRFKPQVILLDYLNIFSSSRLRSMGGSINSYTYIKAIAEEFRGLAVEFELPIVSATQTTRSGAANSDPEMGDTSESFGLPATVDLLLAAIRSEELDADDQIMFKQLKSRYGDINNHKRFVVGIDRGKMKLFDAEVQDIINENNMSDVDKTVAASKTLGLDFKNGDIIF